MARRKKKKPAVALAFAAGLGIACILSIVLVLLYTGTRPRAGKAAPTSGAGESQSSQTSGPAYPEQSAVPSDASRETSAGVPGTEPAGGSEGGSPESTAYRSVPAEKRIAVVIDDVGNNLFQLEPYEGFPGRLTFAVLPSLPYSCSAAERAAQWGSDVLLHLPMESVSGNATGPGAVMTDMSAEDIRATLERNLAQMPGAVGMNNHMGSLATTDERVMREVLGTVKERDLLFLDSLTTPESKAELISAEMGVKFLKRRVFLDNECSEEYVHGAIEEGLAEAERTGSIIMIGHIWCEALTSYLIEHFDEIRSRGFVFCGISDILREQDDRTRN